MQIVRGLVLGLGIALLAFAVLCLFVYFSMTWGGVHDEVTVIVAPLFLIAGVVGVLVGGVVTAIANSMGKKPAAPVR